MSRTSRTPIVATTAVLASLALAACGGGGGGGGGGALVAPPEVRVGERLFRESRFAEQFAARVVGRPLSDPLPGGDPVLATIEGAGGASLPGPYAGLSMSCAACHLSDEVEGVVGGGPRTYCDFAARTPIPDRGDGRVETPRNTPPLVDAATPRAVPVLFHFDGQFTSLAELSTATLTGRNFGWLPTEGSEAVAHVARVVREDDGLDANAADHGGGAYADLLAGVAALAPDGAALPASFQVDVSSASDASVVDAVSRLIAAYVGSLGSRAGGTSPRAFASPYDAFLSINGLPARPDPGEPDGAYAARLRTAVYALANPQFVTSGTYHAVAHPFVFKKTELRGLQVFLAVPGTPPPPLPVPGAGIGSCVSCHVPPSFADGGFHNVGISQVEYDKVHGLGTFAALSVPGLVARNADPDVYLPPSTAHPLAAGPFLAAPVLAFPERTDLGLWNVFANPDVPGPQAALRAFVTTRLGLAPATGDDVLLPATLGWFKTPTVRNLSHSAPYFHAGDLATLDDAVQHYRATALSSRFGLVRNAAPELPGVDFEVDDLAALVAFLRALDEDPP